MGKAGGRKAKKVTIEEFQEILIKKGMKEGYGEDWESGASCYVDYLLEHSKDLSKVIFSTENISFMGEFDVKGFNGIGFVQMGDLTFLMVEAGGDWETPILFCLYIDNKGKVRGYIPENGNTYNKKWKTAYGSEEENPNYQVTSLVDVPGTNDVSKMIFPSMFDAELQGPVPEADKELIFADICNRITVVD